METSLRLAEAVSEPVKRIRQWIEQHDAQILTSLQGLAQLVEAHRELPDRSAAFASRHGWPLPLSFLDYGQFLDIIALADAPRREVTRQMKQAFRPGTQLQREATKVLVESPHFASRRPLVRQALAAMRREQWYLVINGLLPLVEGVLVDIAWPPGHRPAQTGVKPALQTATKSLEREIVVSTLETLLVGVGASSAIFSGFDPNDYGTHGEPRDLNRHAILHGAARRYGTAENALKLFLLLVVIADSLPPPPT